MRKINIGAQGFDDLREHNDFYIDQYAGRSACKETLIVWQASRLLKSGCKIIMPVQ